MWTARLEASEITHSRYEQSLSPDELQRANAFRFAHLRKSFVIGRGILRQLVGRYSGLRPHAIQFAYTDRGKPFLPESELRFNLSHSGGYLVCAFSAGVDVGIDIEQIRPMDDLLEIAARFFAKSEVQAIEQAGTHSQLDLFFQIWTLKESFIKATGEGFGRPLDQFAVRAGPEPSIEILGASNADSGNWMLRSFRPAQGYIGGLAARGSFAHMHWNTFEHEA